MNKIFDGILGSLSRIRETNQDVKIMQEEVDYIKDRQRNAEVEQPVYDHIVRSFQKALVGVGVHRYLTYRVEDWVKASTAKLGVNPNAIQETQDQKDRVSTLINQLQRTGVLTALRDAGAPPDLQYMLGKAIKKVKVSKTRTSVPEEPLAQIIALAKQRTYTP